MTEFDKKLNGKLHEFKLENGIKTWQVAENAGIAKQTLYNFQSGANSMNAENTKKLMDYLNLSVNLEENER